MKKLFLLILVCFSLTGVSQENRYSLRNSGEVEVTVIDRKTEKHVVCYPNGELKSIRYFVNGQPHGTWREFWENGKIYGEVQHDRGEKTGEWRFYDTDGNLVVVMNYESGSLVSAYMFDAKTHKLVSWK